MKYRNHMKLLTLILFSLFTFQGFAQEIELTSVATEVTLYHTGGLISRSTELSLSPGSHELVIKNVSSKLLLGTLKINDKEITVLNKSLVKKLTEEEVLVLQDKKSALENQLSLLEMKYNEPSFVDNIDELQKMMAFYFERAVNIKKELRLVNDQIEGAAELNKIKLDDENAAILKVLVSVEKPVKRKVSFQYLTGSVAWSPGYEVSVDDVNSQKIHFNYQAKVINDCGENWENVSVKLSSAYPLSEPTKLPLPDKVWTLPSNQQQFNQEGPESYGYGLSQIADIEGVEYEEVCIPSFIKLRTLNGAYSIKSNKTIFSFPIDQFDLPATYYYHAFPNLDPEAYLVAKISGWNEMALIDGYAYISVKGDDIGTTYIKFTDFSDTLVLPIGKDNSVFIKRNEKADETFGKEMGSKRFKEHYAFRYELKNNNAYPVKINLYDQVPVSQSKSIEVDVQDLSGAKLNEELGQVLWVIKLKPGEFVTKEMVFEVETDSKRSIFSPSPPVKIQKYRTVKWL